MLYRSKAATRGSCEAGITRLGGRELRDACPMATLERIEQSPRMGVILDPIRSDARDWPLVRPRGVSTMARSRIASRSPLIAGDRSRMARVLAAQNTKGLSEQLRPFTFPRFRV